MSELTIAKICCSESAYSKISSAKRRSVSDTAQHKRGLKTNASSDRKLLARFILRLHLANLFRPETLCYPDHVWRNAMVAESLPQSLPIHSVKRRNIAKSAFVLENFVCNCFRLLHRLVPKSPDDHYGFVNIRTGIIALEVAVAFQTSDAFFIFFSCLFLGGQFLCKLVIGAWNLDDIPCSTSDNSSCIIVRKMAIVCWRPHECSVRSMLLLESVQVFVEI